MSSIQALKKRIDDNDQRVVRIITSEKSLGNKDIIELIIHAIDKGHFLLAKRIFKKYTHLLPDTFLPKTCFLGIEECNLLTLVREYPELVESVLYETNSFLSLNDKGRIPLYYTIVDGAYESILSNVRALKRRNYSLLHQDWKNNTILHFWVLRKASMEEMYNILDAILNTFDTPQEKVEFLEKTNGYNNTAFDIASEVGNRNALIVYSFFLNQAKRQLGQIPVGSQKAWEARVGNLTDPQRASLRQAWTKKNRKAPVYTGGGVEESKEDVGMTLWSQDVFQTMFP